MVCLSMMTGLAGCRETECPEGEMAEALVRSGYIHEPLSLSEEYSYNNMIVREKTVSSSAGIPGTWTLELPNDTGIRPTGSPDDPDYATYGSFAIEIPIAEAIKSEEWNRIAFMAYPDCEGMGVTNIYLELPGISHLINLKNRQWNFCALEVSPEILCKTDKIRISSTARGKDLTYGDKAIYRIDSLRFEKVTHPYKESGWTPDTGIISYSTTGYLNGYEKTAITAAEGNGSKFRLVRRDGSTAYKGKSRDIETSIGKHRILDFTDFEQAGEYAIEYGGIKTPYFRIGEQIWENSQWKVLNFIFCQRCGYNVPGIHSTCHTDLYSEHNGTRIPYSGGWHDAGDLSQQTLQTADVTFALLESYRKTLQSNPVLASRLKEEARWGLEFVMKNRYSDGYRASSMGLLHWLDGVVGSKDDIKTVRIQNLPFDNFLYSGYEAYAALTLKEEDRKTYDRLVTIAEEDYSFAMEKYLKDGYAGFRQPYEHQYNTSQSQFMATASWASSQLYLLTGNQYYADKAVEFIEYVLECQQSDPVGEEAINGFFWRDKSRKSIVHYIHQSREQFYMMAMESLINILPEHKDRSRWDESVRLYAGYILSVFGYTAPYNMIPSGIYHIDEPSDTEAFYALHLFPPADARERYDRQIRNGIRITDEFYIKRFPIWFNIFNGNNAIILSTAKAAAICGNILNDRRLKEIALYQLYWIAGRNPFNQSMIYGEGAYYPPMDSFSSGEIIGAIPVGIKTVGDEDVPCWPQTTNACYKEVWVTSAGKWLSLLSEL